MKEILKAAAAMAVIIAVQMILSYVLDYHVAEVFSRATVSALFYYYVLKAVKIRRSAKAVK